MRGFYEEKWTYFWMHNCIGLNQLGAYFVCVALPQLRAFCTLPREEL